MNQSSTIPGSSDPRSGFLRFRTIEDARVVLCMLGGRLGSGGETFHVEPSRMVGLLLATLFSLI